MLLIVAWIAFAVGAAMLGERKGVGLVSFWLGALFGPFGLLYAALTKGDRLACPFCGEYIRPHAKLCPFCRSSLADYHVEVTNPRAPSAARYLTVETIRQQEAEMRARNKRNAG